MKAPCSGWVSSPDVIKFEVVPCGAEAEIQNSASWEVLSPDPQNIP